MEQDGASVEHQVRCFSFAILAGVSFMLASKFTPFLNVF